MSSTELISQHPTAPINKKIDAVPPGTFLNKLRNASKKSGLRNSNLRHDRWKDSQDVEHVFEPRQKNRVFILKRPSGFFFKVLPLDFFE